MVPTTAHDDTHDLDRYSRQVLFEPIGEAGQRRLFRSRVTLIGCGALGSVIAETLVRAGLGFLRICDRDTVEANNLQRQVLFNEEDVEQCLPKAIAAAGTLGRINSRVEVEPIVVDVNHTTIERLVAGADVILDGTDNFETRYLINDVSVREGIPWVYGAVIGATGAMMPIIPGKTPCLCCVFDQSPPPEMSPTCDTAGVIAPAVNIVASFQVTQAIKILIGRRDDVAATLTSIDAWEGRVARVSVAGAGPARDCTCCGERNFEHLAGAMTSSTATLCGQDAVQINPPGGKKRPIDFEAIAGKLAPVAQGSVVRNAYMLKATVDGYTITLFADARAIIKGTKNPDRARSIYAKYIGS